MARGLRIKDRGGIPTIRPSHQTVVPSLNGSVQSAVKIAARLYQRSESSSQPAGYNVSSDHIDFEPMAPSAQRQKRRDFILTSLNVAIEASNLAKEFCSITPAKPVFGSLSVILTMIKVDLFLRCLYRSIGG